MLYEPEPPSKHSVKIGLVIALLTAVLGFIISLVFALKSGKPHELAQIDRHSAEQGRVTVTNPSDQKLTYEKPDISHITYKPYRAPMPEFRHIPKKTKTNIPITFNPYEANTKHPHKELQQQSPSQPPPPPKQAEPIQDSDAGLPHPPEPPPSDAPPRILPHPNHEESLIEPRHATESKSLIDIASRVYPILFNKPENFHRHDTRRSKRLQQWSAINSIPVSPNKSININLKCYSAENHQFIPLSPEEAKTGDTLYLFRSPRGAQATVSAVLEDGAFLFRSAGGHEFILPYNEGHALINNYGELAGIWVKPRFLLNYPGHNLNFAAGSDMIDSICANNNTNFNINDSISSYVSERLEGLGESIPPRSSMRLNTNIVPGVALGNYYLGHKITEIQTFHKKIPNGLVHIASKEDKLSFYFLDQRLVCIETTSPQYYYNNLAVGQKWDESQRGAMEGALLGTEYIRDEFKCMLAVGNGLEIEATKNGKILLMRVVLK